MAKAEATVEELVGMIERGELRLPEMQRRYVWRAPRVRDLLDSLYRGYPSGAILLWDTDEAVPLQEFAVAQQVNPYKSTRLLLDGQQRLTSLSAVIRGESVKVRGRKKPVDLLFNLEHPEQLTVVTEVDEEADTDDEEIVDDDTDATSQELQRRFERMTFVVATQQLQQLPHWVRVTEVFKTDSDRDFLKRAGVNALDDPRAELYSKRLARLRAIRRYVYRMDILERTLSYDEVTEIFVRVNSLGAKLRSSDLALAQITAKWRGSLARFQAFQEECAKDGFDLDLGIHLKHLIVFATGQSRFKTVGGLDIGTLQDAWNKSQPAFRWAIDFMRSNVGIDHPVLLSSPFLLIAVGYLGHTCGYKLSADEERDLRRWVLLANAKGRYSRGSTETLLDQDLATVRSGGRATELIDRLRLQVGRLDVSPEELEGRTQRSALFKTMFLAFRASGAKDWESNVAISLGHKATQNKLQFHHIFPKAVIRDRYAMREVDDIANLAFIGGRTNTRISAKPPSDYLPKVENASKRASLEAQCIPVEPDLWRIERYADFLAERRRLISDRLNAFLEAS